MPLTQYRLKHDAFMYAITEPGVPCKDFDDTARFYLVADVDVVLAQIERERDWSLGRRGDHGGGLTMVKILIQVTEETKKELNAVRWQGHSMSGYIRRVLEAHFKEKAQGEEA